MGKAESLIRIDIFGNRLVRINQSRLYFCLHKHFNFDTQEFSDFNDVNDDEFVKNPKNQLVF